MLKKLATNNQQLYVFLAIILYFAVFLIKFWVSLNYVLFLIGAVIGISFFWWELLFYLYTRPSLDVVLKNLLHLAKQKKFGEIITFFQTQTQHTALISRSLLFLMIYFITAFFVITSTGSPIGVGLILGLGVRYCLDMYAFRSDQQALLRMYTQFGDFNLNNQVFSQLQKIFIFLFIGLSLLVLS